MDGCVPGFAQQAAAAAPSGVAVVRLSYWGDSYDVVKQSLLRWLQPFGAWSVHPMFTEVVPPAEAERFAAFLGCRLLTSEALTPGTDRAAYFACAATCGNLFLDPDTGLRLDPIGGMRSPEFLFSPELVQAVKARPLDLSIVFDQSHPRGAQARRESVEHKIRRLVELGVAAFAYDSHACFVVAAADVDLIDRAKAHVLSSSHLPSSRLVGPIVAQGAGASAIEAR